jgi:hypothetical protein
MGKLSMIRVAKKLIQIQTQMLMKVGMILLLMTPKFSMNILILNLQTVTWIHMKMMWKLKIYLLQQGVDESPPTGGL